MDAKTAKQLTRYSAWADRTLFAAATNLPGTAVYRETKNPLGSMIGTLNHNYQVDLIWQAHMLQKEHGFNSRRDLLHPRLEDLIRAQTEVNRWFIEWADHQTSESLDEFLPFRFISGQCSEMQKGDMLLHVINHKTYHRGWVCQMFFDMDARPPETDLTVYLCSVPSL
jgi:uncharacterized damage-inducible protein DinB